MDGVIIFRKSSESIESSDKVIVTRPNEQRRQGKMMIKAIAISLLLLSLTLSGCVFPDPGPQNNIIIFSISIGVEGPTELILPLPVWQPLFENISGESGEFEYKVVETPYGDGLWIHVDTFANIKGKWNEGICNISTQMSINLTTMVPLEDEEPPPNAPKYWIPDREVWLNWSSGPLTNIQISSMMRLGGGWQLCYDSWLYAEELEIGWNKIFVEGDSRQAP